MSKPCSHLVSFYQLLHLSVQMWEKAIEMGKQLAKMHENQMFDFMELSQLLVRGLIICYRVCLRFNQNIVTTK